MWLIALYVPGMAPCNKYWIPMQWQATQKDHDCRKRLLTIDRIGISEWFIEAFSVWIPCWQVFRHQRLNEETLEAIALWDARSTKPRDVLRGQLEAPPVVVNTYRFFNSNDIDLEKDGSTDASLSSAESIYTITALEHTLTKNPEPLRKFSALRDFSGENIAFLIAVRDWKGRWPAQQNRDGPNATASVPSRVRRELFQRALHIYALFFSPRFAEFPLNVGCREQQPIDSIFKDAARILYGDSSRTSLSEITPFGSEIPSSSNTTNPGSRGKDSEQLPSDLEVEDSREILDLVNQKVLYWGNIPFQFDRHVFDAAERSIKYLVLTNTWPKFVREQLRR